MRQILNKLLSKCLYLNLIKKVEKSKKINSKQLKIVKIPKIFQVPLRALLPLVFCAKKCAIVCIRRLTRALSADIQKQKKPADVRAPAGALFKIGGQSFS